MRKCISIMLIDDNEIDLMRNQKIIESINFPGAILPFSNAWNALKYLRLIKDMNANHGIFAPDIILLDIYMPIMDGFTFLAEYDKLKISKQNKITIFMLSSSSNPVEIEKANNNKYVAGIISKPLRASNLISRLNPKK
ncbi:MAG: response regulator [Bacteroidota bacterium]